MKLLLLHWITILVKIILHWHSVWREMLLLKLMIFIVPHVGSSISWDVKSLVINAVWAFVDILHEWHAIIFLQRFGPLGRLNILIRCVAQMVIVQDVDDVLLNNWVCFVRGVLDICEVVYRINVVISFLKHDVLLLSVVIVRYPSINVGWLRNFLISYKLLCLVSSLLLLPVIYHFCGHNLLLSKPDMCQTILWGDDKFGGSLEVLILNFEAAFNIQIGCVETLWILIRRLRWNMKILIIICDSLSGLSLVLWLGVWTLVYGDPLLLVDWLVIGSIFKPLILLHRVDLGLRLHVEVLILL